MSPLSPTLTQPKLTTVAETSDRVSRSVEQARRQFSGGRGYLSACTLGLPTTGTVTAISADLARWNAGGACPINYGAVIEQTRADYSRIVSAPVDRVAVGPTVSVFAGMIASSAPAGAEILCVSGDFSSMVFPFLSQVGRGITVRHVPASALADEIGPRTWLVSFSVVQSATGEVVDALAVVQAARQHGARTFCDTTQAAGWLPVNAGEFDATVCHSYKWLCAPRGATFLTISENFADELTPHTAGWYAGESPWDSCYGPQMNLATTARRFDISPAWPVWPGAAAAIEFFASLNIAAVGEYNLRLAQTLCDRLGLPETNSAIVTWPDPNGDDLAALTAAGIVGSGRAGRARVAFHLWNDLEDVDAVARTLGR